MARPHQSPLPPPPAATAPPDGHDNNKLLASFVPALLLNELQSGALLKSPSSQQYEAVALFAVRPEQPERHAVCSPLA